MAGALYNRRNPILAGIAPPAPVRASGAITRTNPILSSIYSGEAIDLNSLVAGKGGGSVADGLGSGVMGTQGSFGASAAQGLAGMVGQAMGAELGQSAPAMAIGGIVGSTLGALGTMGPQDNASAMAAATAVQGLMGVAFGPLGSLAAAAFGKSNIAEALGLAPNSTPGFGFGDVGQGVSGSLGNLGSATDGMGAIGGIGQGIGGLGMGLGSDGASSDASAPGMDGALGSGIGVGEGEGVGAGSVGSW